MRSSLNRGCRSGFPPKYRSAFCSVVEGVIVVFFSDKREDEGGAEKK